jgi:hypothetical protein
MADAADSKSVAFTGVRVQVPPRAHDVDGSGRRSAALLRGYPAAGSVTPACADQRPGPTAFVARTRTYLVAPAGSPVMS